MCHIYIQECFKRLFGDFGKVGAIFLQDKPTSEPMPESPSHFFPKELQVQVSLKSLYSLYPIHDLTLCSEENM